MHFHVIFLDTTSPKYYDRQTLEKHPLGGTEATVVRIAEGLASVGLNVGVIETRCDKFEPIMGEYCYFLHHEALPEGLTCDHYIQIRDCSNSELFPEAKKYVWLHDVVDKNIETWRPTLEKHDVTLVAVSRWHRNNIRENLPGYERVTYIYNPIPEHLYLPSEARPQYDPDIMCWTASPHKGLAKAVELLQKVRERRPRMKLFVFNPGYFTADALKLQTIPGVVYAGPMPCQNVWNVLSKTLCVFNPSPVWLETFGLIAGEANAMGVPFACYSKGALKEVVSSDAQMVEDNDEGAIVDLVVKWAEEGRPSVVGRDEFRKKRIVLQWLKFLGR